MPGLLVCWGQGRGPVEGIQHTISNMWHRSVQDMFANVKMSLTYDICQIVSVQLLSHIHLFVTPLDCSTTGFPVHCQLTELTQTHVHWVGDAIQPYHPLSSPSPPLFNFPRIRVFSNESVLHIRCQSIGTSALASFLPMNIQDWFALEWTAWISLQSKGLSRVFFNTTVQKYQSFSAHLSLWSNSHIYTWLLENCSFD